MNFEDDEESCITILYGFASTAYMAGDEEWFVNHGADIDDCQVRNILCVWDEESEANARTSISDFYEQYKNAIPQIQTAIESLLKSSQSDS